MKTRIIASSNDPVFWIQIVQWYDFIYIDPKKLHHEVVQKVKLQQHYSFLFYVIQKGLLFVQQQTINVVHN